MSIPTFIEITELEQCLEMREYFNSIGATISITNSDSFINDLQDIINICDAAFRASPEGVKEEVRESDVESVLNAIVSVLIQVPHNQAHCSQLIHSFCERMTKAPNARMAAIALRILQNLFGGLGENAPLRFRVFLSMVSLAGMTNSITSIYASDDVARIKTWFHSIPTEQMKTLWRALYETLAAQKQSLAASKVMIELLSTFTEENASLAREDAHRCIVASLADSQTFLMDHLLSLVPVKFLEGELIHDLLTIFVADKLTAYLKFYNAHKDFVESLGLSHEQNLQKMRLLTFMQMAETRKDIPFEAIENELQLSGQDTVEAFVIDVLRTKLVKAKVDQVNRRVCVSSTMHRTFSKQQWQKLRETLLEWKSNLANTQNSIQNALLTFDSPITA